MSGPHGHVILFLTFLTGCRSFQISNRKLEDMNQRAMDAGITNEAILTLEVLLAPVPPKTATKKKSSGGARADANEDEYTDDDDAAPDATPDGVSEEDKQVRLHANVFGGVINI